MSNYARSDITGSCTGPGSPTCYGNWSTLSPVPFGDLASSTPTASTKSSSSSSAKPISIPEYTPQPTASGTWSTAKCDRYAEYVDTRDEDANALANSCSYMVEFYSTSVDDLKKYCIAAKTNETSTSGSSSSAPSTTLPTMTTTPTTTNKTPATTTTTGITTPTPTQSGMVSDCDKFYKVAKDNGCYGISTSHGITRINL